MHLGNRINIYSFEIRHSSFFIVNVHPFNLEADFLVRNIRHNAYSELATQIRNKLDHVFCNLLRTVNTQKESA